MPRPARESQLTWTSATGCIHLAIEQWNPSAWIVVGLQVECSGCKTTEYSVLRTLDEDGIYPTQILVEFHHRFFRDGIARTRTAIQCLNRHHYRLVAVSPSGEDYTFLRSPS